MRYIKDKKIKYRNEIVLHKDGKQIINPTEAALLEDGWVEYIVPVYEPTEEEIFNREKEHIKEEILRYDSSSEVNCFYINQTPIWLDKATRSGLMLRFESELKLGDAHTTLWYNGVQYPLELTAALNMLYMVEKYASQCYDNTQYHLAQIAKLTTIEEVQSYDYRTGYPDKLRF